VGIETVEREREREREREGGLKTTRNMGASASSPSLESTSASSSSTPAASPSTKTDLGINSASNETATPRSESTKKKKITPHLKGPALVEYRCRKKKKAFSNCVSGFYENKFLPGEKLEQEGDCEELFDQYRACYMNGMLKGRQKNGMEPPKPGTLLADFVEEEGIEPGRKA
jgi:hypothetical protein